ncbi:uncharacterized protein LOC111461381 isoform X1 [Cucurbita moschata]|uniref:Uncharacterized protein LOC111461381 isoform X1 n=2 Tax=Cucurbita moschata TaxID=3662 RepID=A0A6J1H814_CUCMO|nr:uncharacterized protein LOC111461381 isoform X1 [Cucurbita moschata]
MFERLVGQLLVGYLGRYVKDIQKEKLKITFWNEEILLENVELILEAFDYLQLPFALKQGRVGRLSIKIPWKKLGWDPIIIILEDIYISASQRDDEEWSSDVVEKREFAGKKAKIAAAELAKLSRRVSDNQAGQSFISYITAKILDNIQISIRNFHVMFHDMTGDLGHIKLGLKFSSLKIMKQILLGALAGRTRGSQVNKLMEIVGLEIYCSCESAGDVEGFQEAGRVKISPLEEKNDFILAPCDAVLSLMVNRSGKIDNSTPQYSVNADLSSLVFTLNDVQLQQILNLWDYLSICRLRDKYGRFRPWCYPLSRKVKGWQILWWHYAQQSVLLDVRKKLKKCSWRYFGQRLTYRRRYVKFYKKKLEFLHNDQSVDDYILKELEVMEKESDIEDILSYRSAAECELQHLFGSLGPEMVMTGTQTAAEKSQVDDRAMGKPRGWLNWLSLGMLGAGGTEDSSQFAGVISDDVVKDIYEATKFHPLASSTVSAADEERICFCSIKIDIHQISATLLSMKYGQEVAKMIFIKTMVECNIWVESATINLLVNSIEMVNPLNQRVLIFLRMPQCEKYVETGAPSCSFQVDVSPKQEVNLSVKVTLNPLDVTYDAKFFLYLFEFFDGFKSFESLHTRALSTLNGIENAKARLLSKAQCIMSEYKKVMWDITVNGITVHIPWNTPSEQNNLVLQLGALCVTSRYDWSLLTSRFKEQSVMVQRLSDPILAADIAFTIQPQSLYDYFDIQLRDLEMEIQKPSYSQSIPIFEKFSATLALRSCLIPNESSLKQLEVLFQMSSLHVHFSPSIYGAALELAVYLRNLIANPGFEESEDCGPLNMISNGHDNHFFGYSMSVLLHSVRFDIDLENDEKNASVIMLALEDTEIWYDILVLEELWIGMKAMNIAILPMNGDGDRQILYSGGNKSHDTSSHLHGIHSRHTKNDDGLNGMNINAGKCCTLHFNSGRNDGANIAIHLNDAEIHCYPYVYGLLTGFYERLSACNATFSGESDIGPGMNDECVKPMPLPPNQRFGFTNFMEIDSIGHDSIPFDCFPFITVQNSGFLGSLESSEWRKHYKVRDREIKIPVFGLEKEPTIFHTQPSKPKFGMDSSVTSGSSCNHSLHDIYLALCGIKIHFHDSSCIVGSLTLPNCKSSLFICEDYSDVLCSVEGLTITSSWTKNYLELVWGPSFPYLCPILNFRVRQGKSVSSSAKIEISVGIQHVCCFLPPEYLAMIIGYFKLPDWSLQSNEQCFTGRNGHAGLEEETSVLYKFEILDSALIMPVENYELQFLRFEIKQLYFTFFFGSSLEDALKDIPPECSIPIHKLAETNNCLNLFGRELLLSLLLFKERHSSSFFCQGTECQNISLVEQLNADIWVRIPCESEFINNSLQATCIMTRIRNCEVIVDDNHALDGFMALLENINQFASVEDQSRCFKSDVLQFLQLTRCLKEGTAVLFPVSDTTLTEFECCIDSLFLKLKRQRNELLEMNYRVEMQFTCSGSSRNDFVEEMNFCFSLMVLYSVPKSVVMAKSSSEKLSPVPDISISRSSQGPVEICVSLPSIDVWLYCSEWIEIVDLLNSYVGKMTNFVSTSTFKDVIPYNTALGDSSITSPNGVCSSSMSIESASEDIESDDTILIARVKDMVITFHFPVYVTESFREIQIAEVDEKADQNVSSDVVEEKYCRFIMVSFHSKRTELLINSKKTSLKSGMEKVCGMLSKCEEKSVQPCPLFEIFGVNLDVDVSSNQLKPSLIQLKIQCECFNIWFSYHVFYFWKHIESNISETNSSMSTSCPIEFEVQLKKVSFLLSDGRWSCCRPLLEILMRNVILRISMTKSTMEDFITGELSMNYNNIQKVFWEPFIEPWNFTINVTRKQESSSLLNSSVLTDVHLVSSSHLNLNLTEPFTECLSRTIDMIKDAWDLIGKDDTPQSQLSLNSPHVENIIAGKHAPYVLQNLTSLPLEYHVYEGPFDSVEFDISVFKERRYVQPGCSVPIYISESAEKQFFRHRSFHSLEKLGEQHTYGVGHHFISIQLDGTSVPSIPISMDLVGQTYFEVDFSKSSNEELNMPDNMSKDVDSVEKYRKHMSGGFVVPVVFDVSVQRYGKLIQLYSTVILFNQTSRPLEFRFDIPFGVAPKILDPLNPGQAMPLPLHLAEAGCVRWRPSGNSYLWSETYNLSNLLSQESKVGLFRSFVSYPSHPSSDPFRCCMSTRNIILPAHEKPRKIGNDLMQSAVGSDLKIHSPAESQERCIHHLTLSTPLAVRSFLPEEAKLIVDTGGMIHSAILSEVKTFFHHIDPSHDLELEIQIHGYRPSYVKFPRAETFCSIAKFDGIKFSLSETITLSPGPIHITLDKSVDAFSGSRELNFFVPFLLYNCTAIPLWISESAYEQKGVSIFVPSYYDTVEHEHSAGERNGLSSITGCSDSHAISPSWRNSLVKKPVSTMENSNMQLDNLNGRTFISRNHLQKSCVLSNKKDFNLKSSENTSKVSSSPSSRTSARDPNSLGFKQVKVRAHMFSPCKPSSADEVMVRASRSLPECSVENIRSASWSSPFYLVPRNGSATVLIPQSSPNAANVISVTSSAISGSSPEITSIIMFQPRYVISNACSKDLCYKQKGTDSVIPLAVGEHFHLQWTDTTRELLVSVRYNEPGWQWSGSFIPDQLGDTLVKMRNYITGSSYVLRIEVQNVDVSTDNKIVGNGHGNSGTNLILLSDDDTGYVPYRIDNFSKERLRIYQQRCENFETIVHPYTSCPYSWDEPCYPRRLTIEVPGERILGSFALDDVQDFVPVCLPSTTGKNERMFHLSVNAEGATKVLSIVDSTYHIPSVPHFGEKKKVVQKQEKFLDYKEKFSVFISYIGISLINSGPEEMVYACAKNVTIDLLQSLDQQKFSVKLLSLQIDNQFRNSPYPVILSFDQEYRSNPVGSLNKDIGAVTRSERFLQADGSLEPVIYLYASKWRKTDSLLVSFEHICLRISDFRLEIEQQVMLSLFEFFKNVSSNLKGEVSQFSDAIMHPPAKDPAHDYFSPRTEPPHFSEYPVFDGLVRGSTLLPSVAPIGAPWQQVYRLARQQKKVYVELFDLAPIKLTVSFSTIPWVLRNPILTSGELLMHRGLLALGDIEGAQIHLKRLSIAHQMASWESIQEILIRHYSRQLFHEIYKVFGSAGVIGNPMGFARRLGIGIRDFLSVPAKSVLQSPTGLITGMVQGTTSLLSNTVYAFSDATTQFSKAARKGIVAFTFDDQAFSRIGQQQTGVSSHGGGVIGEVLEGLTGLLQSPIKGAERHGLPGVFSGIALGITGLVAKPAASVLELTGKTAQSIRNRSRLYQMRPQHLRVRLPRPLSSVLPLRPFSWEEAIGTSVLLEAGGDDMKLNDEVLVACKALKLAGKFVVITQSLILIVSCASLVDLGKPEFRGVAADSKWAIESTIGLDTVIYADTNTDGAVVHIVGSSSDLLSRSNTSHQKRVIGNSSRTVRWTGPTPLPIFETNLELELNEDAENLLKILLSTIELAKERGWHRGHVLHRYDVK